MILGRDGSGPRVRRPGRGRRAGGRPGQPDRAVRVRQSPWRSRRGRGRRRRRHGRDLDEPGRPGRRAPDPDDRAPGRGLEPAGRGPAAAAGPARRRAVRPDPAGASGRPAGGPGRPGPGHVRAADVDRPYHCTIPGSAVLPVLPGSRGTPGDRAWRRGRPGRRLVGRGGGQLPRGADRWDRGRRGRDPRARGSGRRGRAGGGAAGGRRDLATAPRSGGGRGLSPALRGAVSDHRGDRGRRRADRSRPGGDRAVLAASGRGRRDLAAARRRDPPRPRLRPVVDLPRALRRGRQRPAAGRSARGRAAGGAVARHGVGAAGRRLDDQRAGHGARRLRLRDLAGAGRAARRDQPARRPQAHGRPRPGAGVAARPRRQGPAPRAARPGPARRQPRDRQDPLAGRLDRRQLRGAARRGHRRSERPGDPGRADLEPRLPGARLGRPGVLGRLTVEVGL
jgi:hypothetical protein